MTRSARTSRAPDGPCSTGAGRPGATSRPAARAAFASASWTRFSPSSVSPAATAARSRSAGTVLETATSRDVVGGSAAARAAASAMRLEDGGPGSAEGRDLAVVGDRSRRVGGRPRPAELLAAQEARDLEVVGVVPTPRGRPPRLREGPLRRAHAGGGRGAVVAVGLLALPDAAPRLRCAGARAPRGSRAPSAAAGCRPTRGRGAAATSNRPPARSSPAAPAGARCRASCVASKPVATTVIITSSPRRSLKLVPKMMFASGSALARISSAASVTS